MTMTPRQPQQERGFTTRRRILEAAAAVLAERGWSATSVSDVTKRAGVTRGAVQHHFTDREGMLAAAIAHLLDIRIEEFQAAAADLPAGAGRTQAVVRMLVEYHQGEAFAATLQLCVAAAADPLLRPRVAAMEAEMGAKIFWTAVDLLGLDGRDRTVRATIQAFLDSARGLGLAGFIGDDTVRREAVTARWAEMIDQLLF
ncbi:TetR/AcrR family transcriptional regulator [Nocardia cyriacigeorgica]|uniref:TetR/AcrR family transcriptional regulator n=1 Tax=Nocardia cyriacigeorgica TaxID=135487 RepID=UPI0013D099F4|nr:TetR/AcrR family transcriptional regulator [Nocardia cyriacigeorgica]MBF6435309.1 TetR/AcrR family transcriptional regulator [Nocardia cyriacigeorgica]MBF6454610.1 TetR/AcrR family transcriptional regulator [Nocardia cyriacigeorgica]MBF6481238.1 TetR/AcrR family transcriptional regulator [Nocardia cyriacigeorgica]MBF6552504.1 TetR/AcrR family transcriptional regulator [Nocardia cyriacigeorgica]NEW27196.1 TetR/AcrR family transcriptional regulator [Nocardia cyriacigeorgica]